MMQKCAKFACADTLTLSFCHDTAWWVNFLRVFKGKRFLDDRPTGDAMTDACTLVVGGLFRGDWFYFNSSIDKPEWSALHIDHTETLASVLAAQHWGHLWANYWVVIYSDDQPAAQIINKGTTGHTTITGTLQALSWALRSIIFTLLQFTSKEIVTLLRMLFLGYTSAITSFPFTLFCTRTLDVLQRIIWP